MRATHLLSPRTYSTLRRLSALSAAVMLALATGSCGIGEGTQSLAITSLTAQEADAAAPKAPSAWSRHTRTVRKMPLAAT